MFMTILSLNVQMEIWQHPGKHEISVMKAYLASERINATHRVEMTVGNPTCTAIGSMIEFDFNITAHTG